MADDYAYVAKSSLKLKKTDGVVVKAKKKKKKNMAIDNKNKFKQMIEKSLADTNSDSSNGYASDPKAHSSADKSAANDKFRWMTAAERKFLEQQERRQTERIMAKASKSHKQRVEEFNSQLENLTEHYDIPKVSWTK